MITEGQKAYFITQYCFSASAKKKLTRFEACMFFKRGRKMRDGRITQHHAHIGHAQAFFVQQVFGVLHALALVKFENGGAK